MALVPARPAALLLAVAAISTACSSSSSDPQPTACPSGAPVAVAGPDRVVGLGETVVLGGSTLGATGTTEVLWTFETLPFRSTAVLSSTNTLASSFVADQPGVYLASLRVRDQCGTSLPDLVALTVPGNACMADPPVARITGPSQVSYGGGVQLSGQASTSGTGVLTYQWSLESSPAGSFSSIQNPTSATPYLQVDRRGNYQVALVVNDGCADSAPARFTVELMNSAPYVSFYLYGTVPVLKPMSLSAYASDAQGDPITFAWTVASAPAGSTAALSNATLASPTFTPDLPGSYTISVVASDGLLSSAPALGTFSAVDYPPVAVAGAGQSARVGDTVQLDGSASSDANGTPLAFAWTLAVPAGSGAALTAADTARPSFVPDRLGTYRALLTVTSGGLSSTSSLSVAVWPAVTAFGHRIVDAAYSTPLDQVVTVAADPNALYLLDPRSGVETSVALGDAPIALALSPDGLTVAVAHATSLSRVDLSSATVVGSTPINFTPASLAVDDAGNAFVLAKGATYDRQRVQVIKLGVGPGSSAVTDLSIPARAALRPGGSSLYLAGASGSAPLERYDVAGGSLTYAAAGASDYNRPGCGALWFAQDGERIYTGCGHTFLASSAPATDLTWSGVLAGLGGSYGPSIRHLSDSTAAGTASAVVAESSYYYAADATLLQRWSNLDLTLTDSSPLPTKTSGGASYRWYGRYVFYRSDGSERYLILQLDPAAGLVNGFGYVTF